LGRHYCVTGECLYIFTTGGEALLDLRAFPPELNLFEAESSWRISPRLAVVDDVPHRTVERAGIILQLNDYRHADVPLDILRGYFLDGDETALVEAIEVKAETQLVAKAIELGARGEE
jgi:hypothetical protein